MQRKKKLCSILLVAVFLVSTMGVAFADYPSSGVWDLHYIANAPSNVSKGSDMVSLKQYPSGYRAKATSLTGSSDRYVAVTTGTTWILDGNDWHITQANELSSPHTVTTINLCPFVTFILLAHGTAYCYADGWLSTNDPVFYNNL